MEMKYVSSSQINGVGYDAESQTLHVEFTNGATYQYTDVPEDEYENLISAGSVGSYFSANIKNLYSYRRV